MPTYIKCGHGKSLGDHCDACLMVFKTQMGLVKENDELKKELIEQTKLLEELKKENKKLKSSVEVLKESLK